RISKKSIRKGKTKSDDEGGGQPWKASTAGWVPDRHHVPQDIGHCPMIRPSKHILHVSLLQLSSMIFFALLCAAGTTLPYALAQLSSAITPTTGPGNLGTTVTQAGNVFQITGGTRPGN